MDYEYLAAALTLVRHGRTNDKYCYGECGAWVFGKRIGREGILAGEIAGAWTGCRGVFQDFMSCLPVYVSVFGAASQTVWRRWRYVSGHFSGRCSGYEGVCQGVWRDVSDGA